MRQDGKALKIYISEEDRHAGVPLYEWLVQRARDEGMAGATVLRGFEGYGKSGHEHRARILSLSMNLPLIVEIVDASDRIDAFAEIIAPAVNGKLMTDCPLAIRLPDVSGR